MNRIRNKNGFSMVEVIIALTAVIIVSAVALTVILYSISTKAADINKNDAMNFSENVWACFKVSKNAEEFERLVDFAENERHDEHGEEEGCVLTLVKEEEGVYYYTYSPGAHKFTVNVEARFYDGGSYLLVHALDKNGEKIVDFKYIIGGEEMAVNAKNMEE